MSQEICPVCGGPWLPLKPPLGIHIVEDLVYYNRQIIDASASVHTILAILIRKRNTLVSRTAIWNQLYSDRVDGGPNPKVIDVYVVKIRKIIKQLGLPFVLETVWGAGWVLNTVEGTGAEERLKSSA